MKMKSFDEKIPLTKENVIKEANKYLTCMNTFDCNENCDKCPNQCKLTTGTIIEVMRDILLEEGN